MNSALYHYAMMNDNEGESEIEQKGIYLSVKKI